MLNRPAWKATATARPVKMKLVAIVERVADVVAAAEGALDHG
jgi:hypothetical protein